MHYTLISENTEWTHSFQISMVPI